MHILIYLSVSSAIRRIHIKLYLLTNEFKYADPEDAPERVGIFDSMDKVEKAKQDYMDLMPTLPHDIFKFRVEEFELNRIY